MSYSEDNVSTSSSWYIENQIVDNLNRCEINELEEIFEDAQISLDLNAGRSVYQVASIVEVRGPSTTESSASDSSSDKKEAVDNSSQNDIPKETGKEATSETNSPVLTESQDQDDVNVSDTNELEVKDEAVSLVSTSFHTILEISEKISMVFQLHKKFSFPVKFV